MDLEQQLQIVVQELTYRSPDGHFSVLQGLRDGDPTRPVTAVGDMGDVACGETLQLHGQFRTHKSYGQRFVVDSWTPITPTTESGIARYLGSGLVPGVGPALAARIVERFGAQALEIITTQSARLTEVQGIGKRRVAAIAEAVRARREEADLLSFMHALGLGPALSRRIRKRYGEQTIHVLRNDPYLIASEVSGVGFRTSDAIGMAQGYTRDDPRRAAGAVLHVLGQAADEGHTYLTSAELHSRVTALDVPEERVPGALADLSGRELVMQEGDRWYAPPLHRAEVHVAEMLAARVRATGDAADAKRFVEALAHDLKQDFAAEQLGAVVGSLSHGLMVLTGGPGTGKTTTVRAIVAAHSKLKRRIALCSPTGRAAKRLTEATGSEARTVHRLLEYNPALGQFGRNRGCPIEADLVLIDEASMLDLMLAERLLEAIPDHATLILVGDVDQLPPVSPGPTLRELLDSGLCPVVRLTQVFRQAQRSAIVRSAHAIQHGAALVTTQPEDQGNGDLYLVRARSAESILAKVQESLVRMRARYNLDPIRDVQVLTPMRRGPLGTERLNEVLQQQLNPGKANAGLFRTGDKIMQLRNDYERDVFNGDLGEVRRVDAGVVFADMGGRHVAYERDAQDHIALAYASTIHKVQGSEFPAIVLVLHGSHRMLLTRPLLYTAITRAKRLVVVVADERALYRAAHNVDQVRPNCGLGERMRVLAARRSTDP